MVPTVQQGTVVAGVPTVLIEGKPAATTGSACTMCFGLPGTLVGYGGDRADRRLGG